jgi:hypothetical protein
VEAAGGREKTALSDCPALVSVPFVTRYNHSDAPIIEPSHSRMPRHRLVDSKWIALQSQAVRNRDLGVAR